MQIQQQQHQQHQEQKKIIPEDQSTSPNNSSVFGIGNKEISQNININGDDDDSSQIHASSDVSKIGSNMTTNSDPTQLWFGDDNIDILIKYKRIKYKL